MGCTCSAPRVLACGERANQRKVWNRGGSAGGSVTSSSLEGEGGHAAARRARNERYEACRRSIRAHGGRLVVSGVLQRADAPNRNGRVYPRHVLLREARSFAARTNVALHLGCEEAHKGGDVGAGGVAGAQGHTPEAGGSGGERGVGRGTASEAASGRSSAAGRGSRSSQGSRASNSGSSGTSSAGSSNAGSGGLGSSLRRRLVTGRGSTAFGELDHPAPDSPWFRRPNRANVSHVVLEMGWEGNNLVGVVEVLPTPCGNMLRDLYLMGERLGVSSRGWASLRSGDASGAVVIQDDFELITFDFVPDPSTTGAYLYPVQPEDKLCLEELQALLTRLEAQAEPADDTAQQHRNTAARTAVAGAPKARVAFVDPPPTQAAIIARNPPSAASPSLHALWHKATAAASDGSSPVPVVA